MPSEPTPLAEIFTGMRVNIDTSDKTHRTGIIRGSTILLTTTPEAVAEARRHLNRAMRESIEALTCDGREYAIRIEWSQEYLELKSFAYAALTNYRLARPGELAIFQFLPRSDLATGALRARHIELPSGTAASFWKRVAE